MFASRELRICASLLSLIGTGASPGAFAHAGADGHVFMEQEIEIVEVIGERDLWPADRGAAFAEESQRLAAAISDTRREQVRESVSRAYDHLVAALQTRDTDVRVASTTRRAQRLAPGASCWGTCF